MFRRGLTSHVLCNHRYMKSTMVQPRIRQEYESPLFIRIYPGIRAIELQRPDEGNYLSPEVLMMLQRYAESFESNEIVHTIIFTSSSPDLFSKGFNEMGKDTIESAHNLAKTIENYKKTLDCFLWWTSLRLFIRFICEFSVSLGYRSDKVLHFRVS